MNGRNGDALRVAESISDGTPVNWQALKHAGLDLDTLDELEAIESIARAHGHAVSPVPRSPLPAVTPVTPDQDLDQTVPLATWGPLRILDKLGEGGFGEVFRAHDPSLQRDVALKLWRVTDSDQRAAADRMLAEARQLARVRHPHVIVVLGAAEHDGRPGMWAELLRGRTLEEHLAEHGVLGAHEAALIGLDLCRALAAVHAAGMVHRDVKTQNVMREQGGRIVLMDFSAAVEFQPDGGAQSLGTPLTMAPEQLQGRPTTPATDLYGLGVLLYRLVTGRYPIEAKSLSELHDAHARSASRPLRDLRPDLPMDFVQVVEHALAPDPQQRFASAGAMERALAGVVGAQGAAPATLLAGTGRRRRRLLAVTTILALLVIVLVARNASRQQDRPAASGARSSTGAALEAPLSVSAALYRRTPDGEERLLPGARVAPGDALFMELQSSDTVHVYVLNEDTTGEVYALFPAPSFDSGNPLAGGSTHRLPGTIGGRAASWQVTSAGGRENVIVIASRRRLPEVERDIAALEAPRPGRPVSYARLSPRSMDVLRGMGGIHIDSSPVGTAHGRLADILDSLPPGSATPADVWAWQFELANPKR